MCIATSKCEIGSHYNGSEMIADFEKAHCVGCWSRIAVVVSVLFSGGRQKWSLHDHHHTIVCLQIVSIRQHNVYENPLREKGSCVGYRIVQPDANPPSSFTLCTTIARKVLWPPNLGGITLAWCAINPIHSTFFMGSALPARWDCVHNPFLISNLPYKPVSLGRRSFFLAETFKWISYLWKKLSINSFMRVPCM